MQKSSSSILYISHENILYFFVSNSIVMFLNCFILKFILKENTFLSKIVNICGGQEFIVVYNYTI